jgi:hypothetical protein
MIKAMLVCALALVGLGEPVTRDGNIPIVFDKGTQLDAGKLALTARSVIAVTRSECEGCDSLVPILQRLRSGGGSPTGSMLPFKLLLVSYNEAAEVTRAHLAKSGLAADAAMSLADSGLDLRDAPALILVDRSGVVIDSWKGAISPEWHNSIHLSVAAKVGLRR